MSNEEELNEKRKHTNELPKKVLYETPYFNVILKGQMYGIEPVDLCVVVIAFEKGENGLPRTIGVLREYNPMREGHYSTTLVTGRTDESDPDILSTAMREFKEESGYDVSDVDKWCYLGIMDSSKLVMQELPCFAVDITGLKPGEKTGDGTASEQRSRFEVVSIKEALSGNDCFIPVLFMKVFKYMFNIHLQGDEQDLDKLRQRLDMKFMVLDGVNGSLVKELEDGTRCIEYTVTKLTDNIKSTIPKEVDGVKIVIKEIGENAPQEETK